MLKKLKILETTTRIYLKKIYRSQNSQKVHQCTFGRYTDNWACASEPGRSAKSRKPERTGAVNLRLSNLVRRRARATRRTSFVYEPVSISDAISFKSVNPKHPQNETMIEKQKRSPIIWNRITVKQRIEKSNLRCKVGRTAEETEWEGVGGWSFISTSWVILKRINQNRMGNTELNATTYKSGERPFEGRRSCLGAWTLVGDIFLVSWCVFSSISIFSLSSS